MITKFFVVHGQVKHNLLSHIVNVSVNAPYLHSNPFEMSTWFSVRSPVFIVATGLQKKVIQMEEALDAQRLLVVLLVLDRFKFVR